PENSIAAARATARKAGSAPACRGDPPADAGGGAMPYISNAEREAARWIDVADLCTAICHGENCREADAGVQLRKALADGAFAFRRGDGRWDDGVRWGDGFNYNLSGRTDWGKWWLKAKIRIPGDGKVLDNHIGLPDDDVLTGKRP